MERSRNVEDLHHLRLMALLHELVRERDLKGAAEALGLDPRTLSASMERGALSGLAQVALERWLLAEGDRAAAQGRDEVRELAGRVDGVEQRVDGLTGEVGQAVAEVQRVAEEAGENDTGARARELQRLERRMDRLESAGGVGAGRAGGAPSSGPRGNAKMGNTQHRQHPDLVTVDPADDDEEVFGDAWPLVQEWRDLWKDHPDRVRGLRWLDTEARILGAGAGHAGGTRPDPAAGDGAIAGSGAERPAGLAAEIAGRHSPEVSPAEGAAPAWAVAHPGAVAAVAGAGAGVNLGVASLPHLSRSFGASSEKVIRLPGLDSVEIPLMTASPRPDTNWRCQAFSSVSRPRNLEGPSLDPGPDA